MKAGGFWTSGVEAFFDVRVTPLQRSLQSKKTRRRENTIPVIDIQMGTFTPLIVGRNGGIGPGCQNVLRTLAFKLSSKNNELYVSVITWLRIQLSFAILRLRCTFRGCPSQKNVASPD